MKGTTNTEVECYRRTLEIDPKYTEASNNLGCGGAVEGTSCRESECYVRALAIDTTILGVGSGMLASTTLCLIATGLASRSSW